VSGGDLPAPAEGIPPAFRGAGQPSFIGLTDEQVMEVARHHFHMAPAFPLASRQRAAAWGMFDDAMAELSARGLRHVLRKLRERGELSEDDVLPDGDGS
jgi:hypothetical protein